MEVGLLYDAELCVALRHLRHNCVTLHHNCVTRYQTCVTLHQLLSQLCHFVSLVSQLCRIVSCCVTIFYCELVEIVMLQ